MLTELLLYYVIIPALISIIVVSATQLWEAKRIAELWVEHTGPSIYHHNYEITHHVEISDGNPDGFHRRIRVSDRRNIRYVIYNIHNSYYALNAQTQRRIAKILLQKTGVKMVGIGIQNF